MEQVMTYSSSDSFELEVNKHDSGESDTEPFFYVVTSKDLDFNINRSSTFHTLSEAMEFARLEIEHYGKEN
jgi:hypothetical protein